MNVKMDVRKAAQQMEGLAARAGDLTHPLGLLGVHHTQKAQRVLRSGERGIKARNPAGLAASMTYVMGVDRRSIGVGSNKVYAASQQFGPSGGYYLPVKGQYLAIPIADNVRARSNPKYASPRDVSGGEFHRTANGTLLFGIPHKRPPKQRGKVGQQRKGWSAFTADKLESMERFKELLFVLVRKAKGAAKRYITHDPADQEKWETLVGRWLTRGQ